MFPGFSFLVFELAHIKPANMFLYCTQIMKCGPCCAVGWIVPSLNAENLTWMPVDLTYPSSNKLWLYRLLFKGPPFSQLIQGKKKQFKRALIQCFPSIPHYLCLCLNGKWQDISQYWWVPPFLKGERINSCPLTLPLHLLCTGILKISGYSLAQACPWQSPGLQPVCWMPQETRQRSLERQDRHLGDAKKISVPHLKLIQPPWVTKDKIQELCQCWPWTQVSNISVSRRGSHRWR